VVHSVHAQAPLVGHAPARRDAGQRASTRTRASSASSATGRRGRDARCDGSPGTPGHDPGSRPRLHESARQEPENAMLQLMSHLATAVLFSNALVILVLLAAWLRSVGVHERGVRAAR